MGIDYLKINIVKKNTLKQLRKEGWKKGFYNFSPWNKKDSIVLYSLGFSLNDLPFRRLLLVSIS